VHRFSPFTSLQALYISMQSLLPSRGCSSRWPPAVAAPPVEGGGATGMSATFVVGEGAGSVSAFGDAFSQPTDRQQRTTKRNAGAAINLNILAVLAPHGMALYLRVLKTR
jgi:hypothetical protein